MLVIKLLASPDVFFSTNNTYFWIRNMDTTFGSEINFWIHKIVWIQTPLVTGKTSLIQMTCFFIIEDAQRNRHPPFGISSLGYIKHLQVFYLNFDDSS